MRANANDGELRDAPRRAEEASPLCTVGYGSRSLEEFLDVLRTHQVKYLIDVRTSPYSKFKSDFNREMLQYHAERAGFSYLFMGETLGGQPKDPACYTDGKVDYEKLRQQPSFQEGLERLKKAFHQRFRAALMCSEGRPEQCHRSKLIGEALAAMGIHVVHIDEDGALLTQRQVIDRLTQGQMDLFGQPSFSSRKRYAPGKSEDQHTEP
jgi:uncharacterized protein (DUF488 family)